MRELVLLNPDLYLPQQGLDPHAALQALVGLFSSLAIAQDVFSHCCLGQFSDLAYKIFEAFFGAMELGEFVGVGGRGRGVAEGLGVGLSPFAQPQEGARVLFFHRM